MSDTIRYADPPRRTEDGGYLCEVGAGVPRQSRKNRLHGPFPCPRRATWIVAGEDPQKPRPGTVVCDEHRGRFHGVYVALPCPLADEL